MERHLHIVSFDIPYPADYGGVMDVFYKVKALSETGVKIHLHCFEYGRAHAPELENYCVSVNYYKRNMSMLNMLSTKPFIVVSRKSNELVRELSKDDYPILLEGLHTCALLDEKALGGRRFFVRAHNIEHEYYKLLAATQTSFSKKVFLNSESRKLSRFERVMANAQAVFSIQQSDADYLSRKFNNVIRIPAFNPFDKVDVGQGRGDYALYHGKLSVGENETAARFLIGKVFAYAPHKLVVAGANPSHELVRLAEAHPNVSLIANPDDATMFRLIRDAHVNVLYTEQATGLKLKLLNVLYTGRFCLLNKKMVEGTPLGMLCHEAETPEEFRAKLDELFGRDFDDDLSLRAKVLDSQFNNRSNAKAIADAIFGASC